MLQQTHAYLHRNKQVQIMDGFCTAKLEVNYRHTHRIYELMIKRMIILLQDFFRRRITRMPYEWYEMTTMRFCHCTFSQKILFGTT